MNATIIDGKLAVGLTDIFDEISDAHKCELVETLSCQCAVIKHVIDQVIEGWTEGGYHGVTSCTPSATPTHGIDVATRRIAKASGEIAKKEIGRLEEALAREEEANHKLRMTFAQYQQERHRD